MTRQGSALLSWYVAALGGLVLFSFRLSGKPIPIELLALHAVVALSGPSFAREVAKGVPTKMLLAGPRGPAVKTLVKLFDGGPLRVQNEKGKPLKYQVIAREGYKARQVVE